MQRRRSNLYAIACLVSLSTLVAWYGGRAVASPAAVVKTTQNIDPSTLSAEKFDAWLEAEEPKDGSEYQNVKPFVDVLTSRLRDSRFTSDEGVLKVVHWSMSQEYSNKGKGAVGPDGFYFPRTRSFIDTIIGMLYDRPVLAAELHRVKAETFFYLGDHGDSEAAAEYQKAIAAVSPYELRAKYDLVDSQLQCGNMLFGIDNTEAESYYQDVLSFDYPVATRGSAEYWREFTDIYLAAGRGLIGCHARDLDALQHMYFLPCDTPDLQPQLDEAIKEAEESKAIYQRFLDSKKKQAP